MYKNTNSIISIILVLCGISTIVLLTNNGIWLSGDSASYISVARDLVEGKGLSITTHFPPLYPLLLAIFSINNIDPLNIAVYVHAFLLGMNLLLLYHLLINCVRSKLLALFGTILFYSSIPILEVHSWAWTEALFLLFELLSFSFLIRYFHRNDLRTLCLLAGFIGAALLTKYVGITLLLSTIIILLFRDSNNIKKKFLRLCI